MTTYLELSEHVQEMVGIRTRMLLTNWIGPGTVEVLANAPSSGSVKVGDPRECDLIPVRTTR